MGRFLFMLTSAAIVLGCLAGISHRAIQAPCPTATPANQWVVPENGNLGTAVKTAITLPIDGWKQVIACGQAHFG
jgi:hypothetical protein